MQSRYISSITNYKYNQVKSKQNKYIDYNENDDDDQMIQKSNNRKKEKEIISNYNKPRNLKNTNNPNIVKSISLLMEELTFSDLLVLKEQIDSKLFSMGNNKVASKNPNAYYSNEDD